MRQCLTGKPVGKSCDSAPRIWDFTPKQAFFLMSISGVRPIGVDGDPIVTHDGATFWERPSKPLGRSAPLIQIKSRKEIGQIN
jgi:hypothetical protein